MNLTILRVVAFFLLLFGFNTVHAQIGRQRLEEIKINFSKGTSNRTLPFDVPFRLVGYVPKEITEISLQIINKKYARNDCGETCRPCQDSIPLKDLHITITNLRTKITQELADRKKLGFLKIRKRITASKEIHKDEHEQNSKLGIWYQTINNVGTTQFSSINTFAKSELAAPFTKRFTRNYRKRIKKGEQLISKRKAGCTNCLSSNICIKICPWHVNFFSRPANAATGNDSSFFKIDMPPLPANTDYRFYFNFKRKASGLDLDKMQKVISLRVGNAYKKVFGPMSSNAAVDPDFATNFTPAVMAGVNKDIIDYYFDNYKQAITQNDPALINQNDFVALLKNDRLQVADTLPETTLKSMQSALDAFRDNAHGMIAPWVAIKIDRGLNIVNAVADPADKATLKKLSDAFRKMRMIPDNEIENYALGKESLDHTSDLDDHLWDTSDPAQIIRYDANLKKILDNVESAQDEIRDLFIADPVFAKKILTDPVVAQNSYDALEVLRADLVIAMNIVDNYKASSNSLNFIVSKVSRKFANTVEFSNSNTLTSGSDFVTRTEWYVSADIGLAYVNYQRTFHNDVVPYFGVNFNLAPINRQKNYSLWRNKDCLDQWYKNLSIVVGVTANSVSSTRTDLKDLFGNSSLLTGIGFRVAEPVRITFGTLWQKVNTGNPLTSDYKLALYPYVSLSFDIDVAKYLGNFANAIFGTKTTAVSTSTASPSGK